MHEGGGGHHGWLDGRHGWGLHGWGRGRGWNRGCNRLRKRLGGLLHGDWSCDRGRRGKRLRLGDHRGRRRKKSGGGLRQSHLSGGLPNEGVGLDVLRAGEWLLHNLLDGGHSWGLLHLLFRLLFGGREGELGGLGLGLEVGREGDGATKVAAELRDGAGGGLLDRLDSGHGGSGRSGRRRAVGRGLAGLLHWNRGRCRRFFLRLFLRLSLLLLLLLNGFLWLFLFRLGLFSFLFNFIFGGLFGKVFLFLGRSCFFLLELFLLFNLLFLLFFFLLNHHLWFHRRELLFFL